MHLIVLIPYHTNLFITIRSNRSYKPWGLEVLRICIVSFRNYMKHVPATEIRALAETGQA
jgi:hypothetical protein